MLDIQPTDTVVDSTLGGAGHTAEIRKLAEKGTTVAFDADQDAIARARERFGDDARIHLIHANFRHMREKLHEIGITQISGALFDLGWSGYQLSPVADSHSNPTSRYPWLMTHPKH